MAEKDKEKKASYKDTLALPRTDFPMKAGLTATEPQVLGEWEARDLYKAMREKRSGAKKFVLHDGPPYANGHVHLGTALNKILKDFIIRSRFMAGFDTPYVPGWDCHGMPIEHKITREMGEAITGASSMDIRRACREYAGKFVGVQRGEFKRLGALGDWEKPYLTMSYDYESKILEALLDLLKGGYIYKGLRPIHWCATCQTALAEAEVEYADHSSDSIYVKFPVRPGDAKWAALGLPDLPNPHFVIWTTTPWTIPANLAVALHPDLEYEVVLTEGESFVILSDLVPAVMKAIGRQGEVRASRKGKLLEGVALRHPMYDRDSPVVLAEYVTTDTGTGCVHTAPGFGAEDFETGRQYGLDVYTPVDEAGKFTKDVPKYAGMHVFDANRPIMKELKETGALLAESPISHSYPHCWRCKNPLIFRATEQWFMKVDHSELRDRLLSEIDGVKWIPPWGRDRIRNMVTTRPDWCLSRQRYWGVPIPAVYCNSCGEATLDAGVVAKTAAEARKRGSDVWFTDDLKTFLPEGFKCPKCGGTDFAKEEDILDVWFDSSVSQRAVLEGNKDLSWPCDLYLEATDQHRGWFQVSLITATATRGAAPYRSVLTHGLILDEKAKKMSKSLGNVIAPEEVIENYGADILRWLFASVDYTADIRFTRDMLGPLAESYRKVRNTIRFLLGNISDFDAAKDSLPAAEMLELDRFAVASFNDKARKILKAYDEYEFFTVYHTLIELCAVDLSAFYMDVLKDRLYTAKRNGKARRSAQTALHHILHSLLRLVAPVLSFTAEEAWKYLPDRTGESVHLSRFPSAEDLPVDKELLAKWQKILAVRDEVLKPLEALRKEKKIGQPLEAAWFYNAAGDLKEFMDAVGGATWAEITVTSGRPVFSAGAPEGAIRHLAESELLKGLELYVRKAPGVKCARCWKFDEKVGADAANPGICPTCYDALSGVGA
jgi:isoleucyl-tRNA synthetase